MLLFLMVIGKFFFSFSVFQSAAVFFFSLAARLFVALVHIKAAR